MGGGGEASMKKGDVGLTGRFWAHNASFRASLYKPSHLFPIHPSPAPPPHPKVPTSLDLVNSSPFVTVWTSDDTPWSKWGGLAGQKYLSDGVTNAVKTPLLGTVQVKGIYKKVRGGEERGQRA